MEIGQAIQQLRKSKGVRQAELAELIGISKNAMCQIEIGNTFPNKTTISLICSRLNVPQSHLLFLSLTADEIPEGKRQTFIYLTDAIKNLLLND
jgi:transcriptional regulator with XRE-family HTH domain